MENHAVRRTVGGELLRETMRVAGFVVDRVIAADQTSPRRKQRRLDGQALVDGHRSPFTAKTADHRCGLAGQDELALIGIDVQDAPLEMIVVERGFSAQRAQLGAAVERQRNDLADVVLRSPRTTLAQEA